MIIIYLNEMRNISMFLFNFNYIKDLARIIMDEKCNSVYCEAETDRYQIAKNSYNLLMPNDVFNSKTYIIFTFIISIMIFIYYYSMLDLNNYEDPSWWMKFAYIIIHLSLLIILIGMIIYRYTPYDEKGYENYFKLFRKGNSASDGFASVVGLLMYLVIPLCVVFLKRELWNETDIEKKNERITIIFIALCCFIASITLVFNLMNIVMSFRTNTTPMLKTTCLGWSLQNSFKGHLEYKFGDATKTPIETEYDNINKLTVETDTTKGTKSLLEGCGANILSVLDVLIAFEELTNVVINGFSTTDTKYATYLKNIIGTNFKLLDDNKNVPYDQFTSEVSLIFDKKVNIPNNYGNPEKKEDPIWTTYPNFSSEYSVNSNDYNKDYVYTADISYGNANVFYEKYWDIDDTEDNFLWRYDYFVPTYLFGGGENRPNLLKILNYVAIFTVAIFIIAYGCIYYYIKTDFSNAFLKSFEILTPLIALVVFLVFIIVFIRFNTNFNKNVVYKCLDCSYKRALNKLNTIVSPYIRMYDTKITTGNKNYLHHYIITNVFYSILSGNINLLNNMDDRAFNTDNDNKYYYGIEGIKSNRLKFTGMNNSILSNDNQFREYYKSKYSDLYNGKDDTEITKIYNVFLNIFADYKTVPTIEADIDTYFKGTVLKYDTILKIYSIIKKCFELFNEDRFNNNIVYYNNRDPSITDKSKTQITIDSYKRFSFYKNGDKLIPHQFILKLTKSEYEEFVGDAVAAVTAVAVGTVGYTSAKPAISAVSITPYHTQTITGFNTALQTFKTPAPTATDMTSILDDDISDEDSINQKEDIRNKNVIKIIAKYLLIIGHINYNGIEYNRYDDETIKKQIFELRTRKLYQLISNVSYNDTYDGINDTFTSINFEQTGELISIKVNTKGSGYTTPPIITIPAASGETAATVKPVLKDKTIISITLDVKGKYTTAPTITIPVGNEKDGTAATATAYIGYDLIISSNKKYKTLTYMYNYLETKYVSLSSNNNKNYLLNIIQSINNTLNNDDKIITATTGSKESKYLFAKRIEEMRVQPEYEDEKAILEKAIHISTTSFESTYYMNMLIIICYIIATIKSV